MVSIKNQKDKTTEYINKAIKNNKKKFKNTDLLNYE